MYDLLFDVDNTLYPTTFELEKWYHDNAVAYANTHLGLPAEGLADRLEHYYQNYGAVISGLMHEHPAASARVFYDFKGRAPLDLVTIDREGIAKVKASNRRHIALTNASGGHGKHIIDHLGLTASFEAIYGLDDVGFHPKPSKENTRRIIELAQLTPENTVFIEDSLRNLAYPKQIGMKTVLIGNRYADYGAAPDFVDFHVHNLADAMEAINAL